MTEKKEDWEQKYQILKAEYTGLKRKHDAYMRTFDFNRCWLCGTTENVTGHHLELKKVRKQALRQIPLCRDCHTDVEELRKDAIIKKLRLEAYDKGFNDGVNIPCIHQKQAQNQLNPNGGL
jgi:uncharacterized protein YlaI